MLREVAIEKIHPNPFNVRSKGNEGAQPESIRLLAAGMKSDEVGFWNAPLKARKRTDGDYEIAFGNRRLAACKKNGERKLVLDIEELDDAHMVLLSTVENFQRVDLDPEEKLQAWGKVRTLFLNGATPPEPNVVAAAKTLGISDRSLYDYENEWKRRERKRDADAKSSESKGKSTTNASGTAKSSKAKGKSKSSGKGSSDTSRKPITPRAAAVARALGKRLTSLRDDGHDYTDAMIEQVEASGTRASVMEDIAKEILTQTRATLPQKNSKLLQIHLLQTVLAGKIDSAKDVIEEAQKFEREQFRAWTKKNKVPPDLLEVIQKWVTMLEAFAPQLEQIATDKQYSDYIAEGNPKLAERFRKVLVRVETAAGKISKLILPRLEN